MEKHIAEFVNYDIINRIVAGYEKFPQNMLGPHFVGDGYVIVAFHPSATRMTIHVEGDLEAKDMERIHDQGVYAIYIKGKTYHKYKITKYFDGGSHFTSEDPYSFESVITADDCYMFGSGVHYEIYEKLGAHPMALDGVFGTYFAVWAPNAKRVSLVGDLNMWDGRVYPMRGRDDMGIFEIFIPHIGPGEIYKYEILTRDGSLILKSDPYGNYFQMRPENASVVADLRDYPWTDAKYMKERNESDIYKLPMNIYEVHLGSWKKGGENQTDFINYREIAPDLADYCKYMGYTHVELIGISEHPFDGSWGYQVTGYYAPTSRYGEPKDFMYFVDYMHKNGIKVILDWVPAHFPKDTFALGRFDGMPEYEHPDTRLGEHPDWGTYIFNYSKSEVINFLIGSALFWIDKFHIDGLRTDAVASMLYLDYGKQDGQWVRNKYGGNENLDAVEFLKHLNSIVERRQPGAMVIAEESTAWPNVTARPEDNGLGFAYKWNMGWMNDFLEYVSKDPLFRKGVHNKMTFAMAYHHSERYILVLSHDEVVHGKCSMLYKMPGEMHEKFMNLRVAYGFMFGHPGKKLLFMGQDFGQTREWSEERSLDWYLLDQEPAHRKLNDWVRELLHMENKYPALYATDYTDGFEWINADDRDKSIYTWIRKSPDGKKSLVFVCNFTPVSYDSGYRVGVPNAGTYKEILNSNAEEFGGNNEFLNGSVKATEQEWDRRQYSIPVKVPPLACVVFEYNHKIELTPEQKAEAAAKKAAKKATATKKTTTAKKTTTKKASTTKKAASTTAKKTTTAKKATAAKKETEAKTATTKKAASMTAKKETATKKATTAKATTTKKTTTAKKSTTAAKEETAAKKATTAAKKETEAKTATAKKATTTKKAASTTAKKATTATKKAATATKSTDKSDK